MRDINLETVTLETVTLETVNLETGRSLWENPH